MKAAPGPAAALLAARDALAAAGPEAQRAVLELAGTIHAGVGTTDFRLLPPDPDLDLAGKFAGALACLACVPALRRWHRGRGIPANITWDTLADLPRNAGIYARMAGAPGFSEANWLSLHLRGLLYELGRLQFARTTDGLGDAAAVPFDGREPVLGVHIPESGPMTDAACDASFAAARDFFPRHFPRERYRYAVCGSWLLDPQLAEYLPAGSNMVRFQRRFTLMPGAFPADGVVLGYVFRRTELDLDALPQRTTLERAFVQHLRDGRHWEARSGWLEL